MSYYQPQTQAYGSYTPQHHHQQHQPPPQQQQQQYTPPTPYAAAASQYPSTPYQHAPAAAYPVYPHAPLRAPGTDAPSPGESVQPVRAPEIPEANAAVASSTIARLVSAELRHAGFDSAHPAALELLMLETIGLIERLFRLAHEFANNAGRARPIATDLMLACEDIGLETRDLHEVEVLSRKRRREGLEPPPLELLAPPSRSPSPEFLESDEEDSMHPIVPVTLRSHPHYLPPLPPKHTYLRTPAAQPKRSTLPSLEKKLKNAGLVQKSLENLLSNTEVDIPDAAEKLTMGHTINWESGQYMRKRWKVAGK